MPIFSGNTSTNAASTAYDIPYKIKYFSVVNKSGVGITVNVGVLYGSTLYYITPYNMTLGAGETLYASEDILVLAGRQIYLSVTDSVDYYFDLE